MTQQQLYSQLEGTNPAPVHDKTFEIFYSPALRFVNVFTESGRRCR